MPIRLWLDFHISRPERLNGKTFDEIMQEPIIAENLNRLDAVLTPLLASDTCEWFKGRLYEGNLKYFPSYTDELRFIHNNGWMSGDITNNPQFWIELEKPSHFEEHKIVDTIADVIIANYDFRKSMKNFK